MWNYTENVVDHFLHPRNVGDIENADGIGEVGSLACGDMLRLSFKLGDNGRIADAKFKTFGCASAIASSSALTELIKDKSIEEALTITNQDIADYLGGLPGEKMHCSVLGREALEAAIADYRGEPKQERQLEGDVICHCFGITDTVILRAISENQLTTVEEITNYTKAGGGCGKCTDKINALINNTSSNEQVPTDTMTNLERIRQIETLINDRIRPALKQDHGDLELIDIDGFTVKVQLKGACATCPSSTHTMKQFIEKEMQKRISRNIIVQEVKS